MLAYYLHDLSPFIFEVRPGVGLRWYGLSYVAAFLIGYWLYLGLSRRRYSEVPPDKVGDFITWAAVFGVMVGGRLGWVIFYGWRDILHEPAQMLQVWKGGMSSHGGILGLVLFTLWYARRHRLSWTSIGDSLCAVAPVGLFLVRCANFINGELYGRPTTKPWAVQFPQELLEENDLAMRAAGAISRAIPDPSAGMDLRFDTPESLIHAIQTDDRAQEVAREFLTPRHPSQLYEAFLEGVVLFAALWFIRTRLRVPRGVVTGAFFILYALLRIIGEIFRVPDPAWAVGRLSPGQFLSLFLIVIGVAFVAWGLRAQQFERADQA